MIMPNQPEFRSYIYLIEDSNKRPIYIGKSRRVKMRYTNHKQRFGDDCILRILEVTDIFDADFWEQHYISLYISWGFTLANRSYVYNSINREKQKINFEKRIEKEQVATSKQDRKIKEKIKLRHYEDYELLEITGQRLNRMLWKAKMDMLQEFKKEIDHPRDKYKYVSAKDYINIKILTLS